MVGMRHSARCIFTYHQASLFGAWHSVSAFPFCCAASQAYCVWSGRDENIQDDHFGITIAEPGAAPNPAPRCPFLALEYSHDFFCDPPAPSVRVGALESFGSMTRSQLTWFSVLLMALILSSAGLAMTVGRSWGMTTHHMFANAYAACTVTMLFVSLCHLRRGNRVGSILCLVVAGIACFLAWGFRPVLAK